MNDVYIVNSKSTVCIEISLTGAGIFIYTKNGTRFCLTPDIANGIGIKLPRGYKYKFMSLCEAENMLLRLVEMNELQPLYNIKP